MFALNKEVNGQTKTYLTGQKTGNKVQAGSLIGLGTGSAGLSAPMSTEAWGCGLLGAQTNEFRFYYADQTILTGSTSNSTTITASRNFGLAGLLGSGADTYLQFRNTANATITANTPTYFKLGGRPTNTGITLAVGGLLGIVELNSITGTAYSGASNYKLNTATTNALCSNPYNGLENNGSVAGTSTTKLLLDAAGDWYAKVTPNAAYNAVRLNVAFPTDLSLANVAAEINVNVYHAFTETDGGICNTSPQFTSPGEALGGITLNTAGVGGLQLSQLVANPQQAINGNAGDYSSFSSGLASVGVANQVAQSFYFDHKATTEDGVRLQLGIQGSLINLGLLKLTTIKFNAYNGTSTTPVYQSNLNDLATLLQLNLLNLVVINGSPSHKKLDFVFKPGVQFDRLEVVFDQGVAAVGVLGDALRIYEVNLAPALPTITLQPTTANSTNICEGSNAGFNVTATAATSGVITGYQWQYLNAADSTWVDAPSGTTSALTVTAVTNAMNNRWYRAKILGGNASCPGEIYSNEVKLTVTPRAVASDITALGTTVCPGISSTLTASTLTVASPSFKWYSNAALTGSPLSSTNQLTAAPTITTSYWVTVQGTGKCENAPNTAKQVTITVNSLQPPPVLTISSN
ncbi:hypothetical protein AQF98_15870 [Pedobacter sp. Hv1]|nr:hypothetical protein AQF98_15870 [Pedobacter sp. Hv1]